jgi:hypothetical protein
VARVGAGLRQEAAPNLLDDSMPEIEWWRTLGSSSRVVALVSSSMKWPCLLVAGMHAFINPVERGRQSAIAYAVLAAFHCLYYGSKFFGTIYYHAAFDAAFTSYSLALLTYILFNVGYFSLTALGWTLPLIAAYGALRAALPPLPATSIGAASRYIWDQSPWAATAAPGIATYTPYLTHPAGQTLAALLQVALLAVIAWLHAVALLRVLIHGPRVVLRLKWCVRATATHVGDTCHAAGARLDQRRMRWRPNAFASCSGLLGPPISPSPSPWQMRCAYRMQSPPAPHLTAALWGVYRCRAVVVVHVTCLTLATVMNGLPWWHANGFTFHWVDNMFTFWCYMVTPAAAMVLLNADEVGPRQADACLPTARELDRLLRRGAACHMRQATRGPPCCDCLAPRILARNHRVAVALLLASLHCLPQAREHQLQHDVERGKQRLAAAAQMAAMRRQFLRYVPVSYTGVTMRLRSRR